MRQFNKGTFGYDLEQLKPIEGLEVLKSGKSMIAVSGPYQGRILTSSANGMPGKSYGWINWDLIDKKEHSNTIAYMGGESRMWFAPEFGKYSIFFDPGIKQDVKNIRGAKDLNNKKFSEVSRTETSITYQSDMRIQNANKYTFKFNVERTISILSKKDISENLKINLSSISSVAFTAETNLTNISNEKWTKENGLLAIWELGCMLTSADTKVIIPLSKSLDSVTSYFVPVTDERIRIKDRIIYYKADAQLVSKIGIQPKYSKNIMASYSKEHNLLSIVIFNFENDSIYVNSVPENTTPYKGDVINIFNGNVALELNQNWPFYEFESSSAAKELLPNENLHHRQTTYHFEGDFEVLNIVSKKVLGVDLNSIPEF